MLIQVHAQENFVEITGSTNVNTFKCTNDSFKAPGGSFIFSGRTLPNINLRVADFDCRHRIMTTDFQKTLSASQYPFLTVRFLSFSHAKNLYNAQVEVKMMERSKIYNIAFALENGRLIGKKNVKFSDFNIVPPKKMGGMIVVKDDLNLVFALNAQL